MKIEHIAIWVRDLEKMKSFYEQYFDGKSNDMHAGYEVVGQPRLTGDGYYESVIKDPEGNLIEISI
ncbi:VOC family protein [Paenibacillus polymyxa]|uniref:VOC family protein n=1 Tax=Paenibacillus polymyxa TaxID=1406 RepID=UPI0023789AA3|nr:VOC family protein [Paenibacillus polymyxa]WDM24377.1 hypothetical protein J4I02_11980 [Paenibacillus polymyxa]